MQDPRRFAVGETFLEWQDPLPCGEAFGNAGGAFAMAMGFVPPQIAQKTASCRDTTSSTSRPAYKAS